MIDKMLLADFCQHLMPIRPEALVAHVQEVPVVDQLVELAVLPDQGL